MKLNGLLILIGVIVSGCGNLMPQPSPPAPPDIILPDEHESPPLLTPPKAVINGPSSLTAGDIIDLSAQGCTGAPRFFRWEVMPEQFEAKLIVRDGGRTATLPSFPGDYRITLIVGNSSGIDVAHHALRVSGCAPGPVPIPPGPNPPVPNPDPDPDVAPGQYGIANIAYAEALKIDSTTRKATANKIAAEAEALSAKIMAGGVKGAVAITNEISEALDRATDSGWDPWRKSLTDRLKTLYYTEKKLKSDNDWALMLTEIYAAMNKVP
jgi:hypothetical protein